MAEVVVVQDYVNREETALEVTYFFPVEEGATVTEVEAEVEGRRVVGKMMEREKAREEYHQAMARGQTAVMVEEVKADIVKLNEGGLAPGAGCRVRLVYLLEAGIEQEKT